MKRSLNNDWKTNFFFYYGVWLYAIPILLIHCWTNEKNIPLENALIFSHYITIFPNTVFIFITYYVIGNINATKQLVSIRKSTFWIRDTKLKICFSAGIIYLFLLYLESFLFYSSFGLILTKQAIFLFIGLNTAWFLGIIWILQVHQPFFLILALVANYFFHYVLVGLIFI